MPKIRVRLPLTLDLSDEEIAAGKALGEVLAKVRDAGLPRAISDAWSKATDAARSVRRRRRRQ